MRRFLLGPGHDLRREGRVPGNRFEKGYFDRGDASGHGVEIDEALAAKYSL